MTLQKRETPRPGEVSQTSNQSSQLQSVAREPSKDKLEATLRARAALNGIVLYFQEDDRGRPVWIATRWCLTRSFSSLDELARWLDGEVEP